MLRMTCERARAWLAEREGARPARVSRHVASCPGCRAEAGRLGRLVGLLAVDAELEPSAALDRAMRTLLLRPQAAAPRPFAHAGLAGGLAVAALLALAAVVSSAVAQTGAGEWGPLVGALIVVAYLALSSAASLPLLLCHPALRAGRRGGTAR